MFYRPALLVAAIGMLASCGKSSSTAPSDQTTPSGNFASVDIPSTGGYGVNGSSFNPHDVTVPVGGQVAFQNDDSTEHDPVADDGSWSVGLPANSSGTQTFKTAGTYSYHCAIHPSMTGVIVVK